MKLCTKLRNRIKFKIGNLTVRISNIIYQQHALDLLLVVDNDSSGYYMIIFVLEMFNLLNIG